MPKPVAGGGIGSASLPSSASVRVRLQIYVREHHNAEYSAQLITDDESRIYAASLEQLREDLVLYLGDYLSRLHPRHLGRFASPDDAELIEVALPDAFVLEGPLDEDEETTVGTTVAAIVSRDKKWTTLWMPRWDLRAVVPRSTQPKDAALALLQRRVERLDRERRLGLRWQSREWLEWIEFDAELASPIAFTGPNQGLSLLPERKPKPKPEQKRKGRPPTPTFRRWGESLTQRARERELGRAHGRDAEVEELIAQLGLAAPHTHTLARRRGAIVLVGERGDGKSSLRDELAHALHRKWTRNAVAQPEREADEDEDEAASTSLERTVWLLDASRIVASSGFLDDWRQRCLHLAREAEEAGVVWCLGELILLLDAGKSVQSDNNVAMTLKPCLEGGADLLLLGEATPEQWAEIERRNPGFARAFDVFRLDAPDETRQLEIIAAVAAEILEERGIEFSSGCQRMTLTLARRYTPKGMSAFGAAIAMLRRMAATQNTDVPDDTTASKKPRRIVRLEAVDAVAHFCRESGLPPFLVRDDIPLPRKQVREHFTRRIMGQPEAIDRLVDLVAIIKAGLTEPTRPLGSFLFVGPTGVGKTESAKALAEFVFGDAGRLLRFDMSEFFSASSVTRFVGDERQEGVLVAAVRRSPFTVILLDEIEKAHPAVYDVLLQVLGEARLTDPRGRVADFRNCVILMSSNLGVDSYRPGAGFGEDDLGGLAAHFEAEVRRFFRPEFVNRLDRVVSFSPLARGAIQHITGRELAKLRAREGIAGRGLGLELGEQVPDWLAERGVSPKYGARPLKREIERQLAIPLAIHLSQHRHSAVRVGVDDSALVLEPGPAATQEREGDDEAAPTNLRDTLAEIRRTRYQCQRWRASGVYQQIVRSLELVDRLGGQQHFWLDHERATARMGRAEQLRGITRRFDDLYEHLCSFEDLGFEALADAGRIDLGEVQTELRDKLIPALNELELEIFARSFESPNTVWLVIAAEKNAGHWMGMMYRMYATLAREQGWSLTYRYATAEVEQKESNPDVQPKPKRKPKIEDQDWRWANNDDMPVWTPASLEDHASFSRELERRLTLVRASTPRMLRAWQITGPNVIAWLAGEPGVHQRVDHANDSERAEVLIFPGKHPLEPVDRILDRRTRTLTRLVSEPRRIVSDERLDERVPLHRDLLAIYRRFMRANIYHTVFGEGAAREFRRKPISPVDGEDES